jgi:hypothetical protein
MTKIASSIAFTLALGLAQACGSGAKEQVTPATCVKPGDPGCRIIVDENSFVRWTGPSADGGTSTAVVRYTPGRFCMSGTVDSGADGSGWGAFLAIGLDEVDEATDMVIPSFDASALGVAQVRFSVKDPPLSGVLPQITQIQSADCTQLPDCVTTFDRSSNVTSPGIVTVPLTDFNRPDANHPNATLDRALMTGVHFYVPSSPSGALDYDFCIEGLAFLDASGQEITP